MQDAGNGSRAGSDPNSRDVELQSLPSTPESARQPSSSGRLSPRQLFPATPSALSPVSSPASSPASSSAAAAAAAANSPPSLPSRLPLESIESGGVQREPDYEAKQGVAYSARAMNIAIQASLSRYGLTPPSGRKRFILGESNETPHPIIAITPSIEVGNSQLTSVADYFNNAPLSSSSKSKTASPSSSSVILKSSSELWNELRPFLLERTELVIKILFAFTVESSSWVVGEISISKNNLDFNLHFSVLDPQGQAKLQREDHRKLKENVSRAITQIHANATIKETILPADNRFAVLADMDEVSSGVMATEILLCRAAAMDIKTIKEASNYYRRAQLFGIRSFYEVSDETNRGWFIKQYARQVAQSDRTPHYANSELEVIKYGTGDNQYVPMLTAAQESALLANATVPEVMERNRLAAFWAAANGHVLLLKTLLGPEVDEVETREELLNLSKLQYGLAQKRTELAFEIAVTKMLIKEIDAYLKLADSAENRETLKRTLGEKIEALATSAAYGYLSDHLSLKEGEVVYFNNRRIQMESLPQEEQRATKEQYRAELVTFKTKVMKEFNPHELHTIRATSVVDKSALKAKRDQLQRAIEKTNTDYCELVIKLEDAITTHRRNVSLLWKFRRHTLPDFFPRLDENEVEFLGHALGARVPIHARVENYNTLLHVAYEKNHINAAAVLLARGAKIDVRNNAKAAPNDLVHQPKANLLTLNDKASQLVKEKSKFLQSMIQFRAHHLAKLEQQEKKLSDHSLSNKILYSLPNKVINIFRLDAASIASLKELLKTLGDLINIAELEQSDAELVGWIIKIIEAHFENRRYSSLNDFFDELRVLYNAFYDQQEKYEFIRLPKHLGPYLLQCTANEANHQLSVTKAQLEKERKETIRLQTDLDETRRALALASETNGLLERRLADEIQRNEAERKRNDARLSELERQIRAVDAAAATPARRDEPSSTDPSTDSAPASATSSPSSSPPTGATPFWRPPSPSATHRGNAPVPVMIPLDAASASLSGESRPVTAPGKGIN